MSHPDEHKSPSSTSSSTSPDQTPSSSEHPGGPRKKKSSKLRPFSSCIPCRNRKVRCDRLSPCDTCKSRSMESECRYVANEDDRRAIGASETITELRRVVRGLRGRVEECYSGSGPGGGTGNHPGAGTGTGTGEEEEDLMVVYEALQTAAPEGVYLLVEMLRSGKEIGDVACLAREYLGLID